MFCPLKTRCLLTRPSSRKIEMAQCEFAGFCAAASVVCGTVLRGRLEQPRVALPCSTVYPGGCMCTRDRTTPRFNLSIPVRVRWLSNNRTIEYSVETSNLSLGGMYFSSELRLELDTPVRAYFQMPEQIFGKYLGRWCCDGSVVHLAPNRALGKRPGVGISFRTYAVLAGSRVAPIHERRSWSLWY